MSLSYSEGSRYNFLTLKIVYVATKMEDVHSEIGTKIE